MHHYFDHILGMEISEEETEMYAKQLLENKDIKKYLKSYKIRGDNIEDIDYFACREDLK